MADEGGNDMREGWHVRFRIGWISAVSVPAVLAIAILIAGLVYTHTLGPRLRYTVTPQPAPGLEATVHAGTTDPEVTPRVVHPDRAIEHAKAEIAAEGLPGWPKGGR